MTKSAASASPPRFISNPAGKFTAESYQGWPGAGLFETHSAAESFAWWIVRLETRSFRREPRWVARQGRSKEPLLTALRSAAEQAWRTARQDERAPRNCNAELFFYFEGCEAIMEFPS